MDCISCPMEINDIQEYWKSHYKNITEPCCIPPERQEEEDKMKQSIKEILEKHDGLVMGGNDFLYTKELPSHPCSYFLYHYGPTLVACGLDTIFLENHYIKEAIQTRGLIGHVMYCAYLYNIKVIGLEGKFNPEEYKKYTNKEIDDVWTTVAFTTKKRLDRLNVITKDIVDHHKKGKYLLFCGMSHVNDEIDVTECKGIKTLLNVPGCGASFDEHSRIVAGEPFRDVRSMYERPADYMIYVYRNLKIDNRLYIDATTWCMVHDYLFFYKSYRELMLKYKQKYGVDLLWKHTVGMYPDIYNNYVKDMIKRNSDLSIPEKDIQDICSYVYSIVLCRKTLPSRSDLVKAFTPLTDQHLIDMVDQWSKWLKKQIHKRTLPRDALDICSDCLFLDKKNLSLNDDEESYVQYLKNKFIKQLERPEHKLYTTLQLMKSLGMKIPSYPMLDRIMSHCHYVE